MTTRRAGFTMIEMMVVIGIVAILALIAVPSYQDGIVRDQINGALPLADIAKTPIAGSCAPNKALFGDILICYWWAILGSNQ